MQILVEVPERLVTTLAARGVDAHRYLGELVLEAAKREEVLATDDGKGGDLTAFFREMAECFPTAPEITDYAYTRESFYEDHD